MLQKVTQRFTAHAKGLISESNELDSPNDSTLEESNYERLPDNTARRRRPIIQERDQLGADSRPVRSLLQPLLTNNANTSSFLWKSPGRREGYSILVEEAGGRIRFYKQEHNETRTATGAPIYLTNSKFFDEIILSLWGIPANLGVRGDEIGPCTYAEGDGSLYIFSGTAGTIRVDDIAGNTLYGALQFTPIHTWIRDHEGISESLSADKRAPGSDPTTNNTYNGLPIQNGAEIITQELPTDRHYNLTNQGWTSEAITEVRDSAAPYRQYTTNPPSGIRSIRYTQDTDGRWYQTKQRNAFEYPASTDRYLDGRFVDESGSSGFIAAGVFDAQKHSGDAPKGARIGASDYFPAGTLVSTPNRHIAPTANVFANEVQATITANPAGALLTFTVRFQDQQFHSRGRPDSEIAVFVHQATFHVDVVDDDNGGAQKTFTGGFSGVMPARKGNTSRQLIFTLQLSGEIGTAVGAAVQGGNILDRNTGTNGNTGIVFFTHPSPFEAPHRLPAHPDAYNYQTRRRPGAGAFFANRLWQLGDEHDRLYYSQLVQSTGKTERTTTIARESLCYSAQSATDGDDPDLVATDGGYIYLPNSGTHLAAVVLGQSLYILTDAGIYVVSPGEAGFFTPKDFRIAKLTEAEVLGPKAYAVASDTLHVATDEGILVVTPEGITNITLQSVQSRYKELVSQSSAGVEIAAVWNPEDHYVRWAFSPRLVRKGSTQTQADLIQKISSLQTVMLTYSVRFKRFYEYRTSKSAIITDMVYLPRSMSTETYNRIRYQAVSRVFAGATSTVKSTFALECDFNRIGQHEWIESPSDIFRDWRPNGAITLETEKAFMLSNHIILGDGHLFQQIHYLVAHNRNVTEDLLRQPDGSYKPGKDGSTLLSARWDWMDQERTGKYTSPQQTYKHRRSFITPATTATTPQDRGEPLLVTKVKVRGRGRELRLYWESEGDHDSHLVGYSLIGAVLDNV